MFLLTWHKPAYWFCLLMCSIYIYIAIYFYLGLQLKECLDSGFVPSWLTRGRTSLLQKDKSKGNVASNYRPITCLPLMWKLLTGVIADQIVTRRAERVQERF